MDTAPVCNVFNQLDRELWVVTAAAGARRGGLVATFVSQASLCPLPGPEAPRVLVGLARQHHTWELVEASGAFALHLLGEEHLDWVWRFGLPSGRDADKLAGLSWSPAATGAPLLEGARGWLSCRVEARLDVGDRTVYVAAVLDGGMVQPGPVLTMKRLLQLAPVERLRELRANLANDSAIDAAAVRAWRQAAGVNFD
jgi:flavin reductase (DIM6/NTAB) family NADH-FMN oxidoreductase RutF